MPAKARSARGEQDKLYIRLLNRSEIVLRNDSVDALLQKSKKARILVNYLILRNGNAVQYGELIDVLWDKASGSGQDNALKVLVCRTRAMLSSVDPYLRSCIKAVPGGYCWDMDTTAEVDVFLVESLCQELLEADALTDVLRKKLDRLLGLYSRKLLPEMSREPWVMSYVQRMQGLYTSTIAHVLDLLREVTDWECIIKVCRMSLDALPMETKWQEEMMRATMMLNRRTDVMTQYEYATQMERRSAWGEPSREFVEMYTQSLQMESSLEADVETVVQELLAQGDDKGALMCDYAIFKHVYNLQQRSLERYAQTPYLAIFRIASAMNQMIQLLAMEEAMQRLGRLMQQSLRRGDTITRYTPSQYAVLLQGSAPEAVKTVLDRVRLGFYSEMGNIGIALNYEYRPLVAEESAAKIKLL